MRGIERYDYEYERNGVSNLFMFSEPLAGWRHVEVTERRTKKDYAHQLKSLVDIYHPEAEKITLIHDNLNTHVLSALYETFEPQEAKPEQQFQIQNVVQETKVLKCLRSRGFVSIQQFQIQNVVKDTKGSMYLLARVLL